MNVISQITNKLKNLSPEAKKQFSQLLGHGCTVVYYLRKKNDRNTGIKRK